MSKLIERILTETILVEVLAFIVFVGGCFGLVAAAAVLGDEHKVAESKSRTERLLEVYAACRTPERDTFDDHAACLAFARCVVDGGPACEETASP